MNLFRKQSLVNVTEKSHPLFDKWLHVSNDDGGPDVEVFLPDETTIIKINREYLYAIYHSNLIKK